MLPLNFSCLSQAPPVRSSLIPALVVNGCPACALPPPALPPLKLPAGYYRDVFINAVYASLSTLSLSAISSPFSTPLLPFSLRTCRLSLALLSLLHLPLRFISPPFPFCRNLITSSYNFHRRRGFDMQVSSLGINTHFSQMPKQAP